MQPVDPALPPLNEAGRYRSEREALRHATVLLAMREDCWIEPTEAGWHLLVKPTTLPRAGRLLAAYDEESLHWPPAKPAEPSDQGELHFLLPLLWAQLTCVCFLFQGHATTDLAALGCMDNQGVFAQGELWRPFTALFLHADLAHLTGNLLSGLFAFAAVDSALPRLRGWGLLGLSAYAANLLSGLVHQGGYYRSLGASTAVFAALGLLTGAAVRRLARRSAPLHLKPLLAPMAAGLGMLALLGAGGENTDLTAHVLGLACGGLAGFLGGKASSAPAAPSGETP